MEMTWSINKWKKKRTTTIDRIYTIDHIVYKMYYFVVKIEKKPILFTES